MRKVIAVAIALLPLTSLASEARNFCVIPRLVAGVPADVAVPYIDKPFCGAAIIDNKYVRLDDVAPRKQEGAVECSDTGDCLKTNRYFARDTNAEYIIIFHGPKHPVSGT